MPMPSDQFQWLTSRLDVNANGSGTHFHIQWRGQEWWRECFATRAEATARALELSAPNEEFTVVEVAVRCLLRGATSLRAAESISGPRQPAS
jgi:hypothetical protein